MPIELHERRSVQELMDRGAQVVEVLPLVDFEKDHLPGAIHLPLRRLHAEANERLDPSRPIIVYCWDSG
jgi:rhodanese-related sulfurtransferase